MTRLFLSFGFWNLVCHGKYEHRVNREIHALGTFSEYFYYFIIPYLTEMPVRTGESQARPRLCVSVALVSSDGHQ